MAVIEQERATPRTTSTAMAVVQGLVAAAAVLFAVVISDHDFIDLDVYRAAAKSLLDGQGLYGSLPGSPYDLKYIYPPFAAVVLVPVTFLPLDVLHVAWTLGTVALVYFVLRAVMRRLGTSAPELTALALLAPALLLEPIRGTIGFGQVNMVIVALVVADCTGVIPKRFRGVGIGLAAAIKITPLAFGLLLLVRRDFASIVRAGVAFVVAAGIGAVFAWEDTKSFWTDVAYDTDRGGKPWYGPNQAITGPLARLGLPDAVQTGLWALAVLLVVAAAAYAAWQFTRTGEHVLAMCVVALAALLAAPFAASHHWAYVILLLPLLVAPQYRSWRYLLALATVVFLLGAQWDLPGGGDRELHNWDLIQQFVGNGECFVGIALLVGAVVVARERQRSWPTRRTELDVPERSGVQEGSEPVLPR
ncbi:glycosyltransferase family 87 protein [Rhodococcus sp. X156]|uniref:glycosyltransferase family 87 protein n=1 Tax=Rhodococcus sp. X156 TaxID=2499145 RepID=UPI000FD715FA|nr:glycosyltransferase family 87 protein [Rhodococcus sp. X156]